MTLDTLLTKFDFIDANDERKKTNPLRYLGILTLQKMIDLSMVLSSGYVSNVLDLKRNEIAAMVPEAYKEIITGYGFDVTLPMALYYWSRFLTGGINPEDGIAKPKYILGSVLALAYTAEVLQYFGIDGHDRLATVFDPKDFVAYAVGLGLALGIDKLTRIDSWKKFKQFD
ncbi:MAG: hypothetical protein WC254_00935 [Candidatus Woesearchaeota archaeon]|jgi:hypothetical protein